jgi:FMN phosphatase YigB (HAD superfamily)
MQKTTPKLEPACFVIKSFEEVGRAIAYIHRHHADALSDGKPLVVRIDQKQETLSSAQRRLYWLWMTEYGKQRGLDKEEASAFFKYKYLSIIYNRDNVGEYPETFKVMRELKESGSSGYEPLRQFVSNRMSITEATTKQMAEFLTDIEVWCLKDGVRLTCPDDLKYVMEMRQ